MPDNRLDPQERREENTQANTNELAHRHASNFNPNEICRLTCITHQYEKILLLHTPGKPDEWTFGRADTCNILIDYSRRISKVHFIITKVNKNK